MTQKKPPSDQPAGMADAPPPDLEALAKPEQPGADPGPAPAMDNPTEQANQLSGKELLLPAAALFAAKVAPNWQLSEAEVDGAAECYGALLDKYFGSVLNGNGPEAAALLFTLAVFIPRYNVPMKVSSGVDVAATATPDEHDAPTQ